MTFWHVFPSPPTGNNRHIELAGTDLWITGSINNVFVYPSALNIDKFKETLSRTLSLWPFIAGRFLVLDNEHYIIEMSDNAIPLSFIENTDLIKWPLDSNVVVDKNSNQLQPFLDEVQTTKLIGGSRDEPLFRLKLTHIVQSGEWIMGASWSHILGDADSFLQFLKTISHLYQNMEPPKPIPVFERQLWSDNEVDESLLSDIKQFLDDDQMKTDCTNNPITYVQLNICFSGEQLKTLRKLIDGHHVSTQDVLSAYIILILNTHCTQNNEQPIVRTNTIINYRNESNPFGPLGLIANAVLMPLSDCFEDPTSLSSIAKTIRQSINQSRNIEFIKHWVATADKVMRTIIRESRLPKMSTSKDRIVLNSNFRYDWANLVDFGHTNKCRFYTTWTRALYLRVFRLNPVYDGNRWMGRDQNGAEVAFRIAEDQKKKFIDAWQKDIAENFVSIKL
ncbi:unnamed protein product [Adineta steineri]|uniref:Uncharacterized protein n=1 Tax=Adineta steineri TaxID=433720 RepID=A0A815RKS0_9BILA|nr:unnamed protein product [Adineta steineri]CAF4055721.1 unnamed protein product [Adineta steineri]